jgi:hypothetical protein
MHLQPLIHHIIEYVKHRLFVQTCMHFVKIKLETVEILWVFCIERMGFCCVLLKWTSQLLIQSIHS